jgi:O-antigen/teichoic acid export membrane protein
MGGDGQLTSGGTRVVAPAEMTAARHRRDAIMTTVTGLAVFGLAFVTGPILARALGPAGRGSVAAVIIPTQVLGWLLMFGIPQAAAYHARQYQRRALVMSAWVVAGAVGLPLVLLAWPFVPALLDQHPAITVDYFRAFLLTALLVLPYVTVIDQLRGVGRTSAFNFYRAVPTVLNAVSLVALFAADALTLERALLAALVSNLVGWLGTIAVNRAGPGRGFDRAVFRDVASYGGRVWIGTLSTMVVSRFDQFIMVTLVEPRLLGLYVVAATAAQVTGPIGQGIALSLLPHLRANDDPVDPTDDPLDATAGLADDPVGGSGRNRQRTRTALIWTAAGSGLVAAVGAATAWYLVPLVYGQAFAGAVPSLLILLPGQVCLDLANVVGAKLEADDRPGAVSTGTAIAAGLTVALTVPAVVRFSIEGAAAVTTLGQLAFLVYVVRAAGLDDLIGKREDGR